MTLEGWAEDERKILGPIREEVGINPDWHTDPELPWPGVSEGRTEIDVLYDYIRALEAHTVATYRAGREIIRGITR